MKAEHVRQWMCAENPAAVLRAHHAYGTLATYLPEVEALWGVPPPHEHHPEIDAGEHTVLVLEQAAVLSEHPAVRWAALVLDLGKGLTAEADWPRHPGHEERGMAPAERLGVPADWAWLGAQTSRWHLHVHRAKELSAEGLVRFFESSDFSDKPALFEAFLLVCEAYARGRKGLERRAYPQRAFMHRMFEVFSACPNEPDEAAHETRISWMKAELQTEGTSPELADMQRALEGKIDGAVITIQQSIAAVQATVSGLATSVGKLDERSNHRATRAWVALSAFAAVCVILGGFFALIRPELQHLLFGAQQIHHSQPSKRAPAHA